MADLSPHEIFPAINVLNHLPVFIESFPVRKKIPLIHLSESYEMGTGELLFSRRSGNSGLLTGKRLLKACILIMILVWQQSIWDSLDLGAGNRRK